MTWVLNGSYYCITWLFEKYLFHMCYTAWLCRYSNTGSAFHVWLISLKYLKLDKHYNFVWPSLVWPSWPSFTELQQLSFTRLMVKTTWLAPYFITLHYGIWQPSFAFVQNRWYLICETASNFWHQHKLFLHSRQSNLKFVQKCLPTLVTVVDPCMLCKVMWCSAGFTIKSIYMVLMHRIILCSETVSMKTILGIKYIHDS